MTATNHALTGALIAVVSKQPALALPGALASHFVLDALPHFGYKGDIFARNRQSLFLSVLAVDALLLLGVATTVVFADITLSLKFLVFGCMLAAMSPDFVWAYRFYLEIRTKKEIPKNWLSKFHSGIQWSETPQGIFFEVPFMLIVSAMLFSEIL